MVLSLSKMSLILSSHVAGKIFSRGSIIYHRTPCNINKMALPTDLHDSVTRERSSYPQILEFANESRTAGEFTDVTLVIGMTNIPANRVILSCCSEFFRTMFQTQMRERYDTQINITADLDENSVKALIDFIYTGKITINNENVMHLIKASDYLQLDEPKQFCIEFLDSVLSLATCNVFLKAANLYGINQLQERVYKMVSGKLTEFAETNDFKLFTKEDLISCVTHLDRKLVKETSVYQAIVTWIKHDEENRNTYFPDLLLLVNLDNLPQEFLRDVVSIESLVKENLLCMRLVMEAIRKLLHNDETAAGSESKIISVGGQETVNRVIKVFSCDDSSNSILRELPLDTKCEKAIRLRNHVYFFTGSKVVKTKLGQQFSTFKEVSPMKERFSFSAAVFDDTIVVTGGVFTDKSAECFVAQQNEWKSIASTNVQKNCNKLVTCKGCLYDTGGFDEGKPLTFVERLRGLEEEWELVQPMQTERYLHVAVSCNGFVYVIGGFKARKTLSNVEKYDPSLNLWVYAKEMNIARYGHAACVLRGKIYVVGGKTGKNVFVKEIECYDPAMDAWSIVGNIAENLFRHSLIVM